MSELTASAYQNIGQIIRSGWAPGIDKAKQSSVEIGMQETSLSAVGRQMPMDLTLPFLFMRSPPISPARSTHHRNSQEQRVSARAGLRPMSREDNAKGAREFLFRKHGKRKGVGKLKIAT